MFLLLFLLVLSLISFVPSASFASETWTPLITASTFDGLKADILTTAIAIISVLLIIAGAGMLWRMFGR